MPARSRPSLPVRATAIVLLAASLTVLAPLTAPATAAPPPEDVCGACDATFEEAVADAGGDVTVAQSTLDVRVAANGSTTVVARNRLAGDGASWVADHREQVVAALAERGDGLVPVSDDAAVRVDGDTVVVRYAAPNFARGSVGGVVLVDAFHDTRSPGWEVNADRFSLHAPDGHSFTAGVEERGGTDAPTVVDGTATWARDEYPDDVYVAFAPSGGFLAQAATALALTIATGPAFLAASAATLAVPALVLGLLVVGFGRMTDRLGRVGDVTTGGRVLAAASAALAVAVATLWHASDYFLLPTSVPLFAALTGVVVGSLAASGRLDSRRALGLAAVGTPLVLGVLAAVVGAVRHPAVAVPTVGRALTAGLLAAQLWLFAPLAAAAHADRASRWRLYGVAFAPLVAAVLLLGPGVLFGFLLAAWVLTLAVFALPAYWLGAALRDARLRSV